MSRDIHGVQGILGEAHTKPFHQGFEVCTFPRRNYDLPVALSEGMRKAELVKALKDQASVQLDRHAHTC
jgi:hypothetical protein